MIYSLFVYRHVAQNSKNMKVPALVSCISQLKGNVYMSLEQLHLVYKIVITCHLHTCGEGPSLLQVRKNRGVDSVEDRFLPRGN